MSAVARRVTRLTETAPTNLGMARGWDVRVPASHLVARFGTPSMYVGERGALHLAAAFTRDADAFVDIGAHVGYFSFFVRHVLPDAPPVYFVEPDPELFSALEENVVRNGLHDVHGLNAAVSDRDGTATFYRNRTDSYSGSLTTAFADRHEVQPTTVTTRQFAGLAQELGFRRACVKVDVEGAEWAFLDGAEGGFDRICCLIIEILGPAHRRGLVQAVMARTGWHAYYINDRELEPSVDGTFVYRDPEYNWCFCRHAPAELAKRLDGTPLRVRH
jgi:FkbM family methyltransferase